MIVFLTLAQGTGHIDKFINRYGRQHGRVLLEMTYQAFLERGSGPTGAYVFCDVDRMNPTQKRVVGSLWDRLSQLENVRLFNNPHKELCRFDLLRAYFEAGVNRFNVHRVIDAGTMKLPVFLRIERDHMGPRTGLLHDAGEIERETKRLILQNHRPKEILAVEYQPTDLTDGRVYKYGAFRIGPTIVCQHILMSTEWSCKRENMISTPEAKRISEEFFLAAPHREILLPLFEMANIEYGRMDYALADGKVQVWEINDNPMYTMNSGQRFTTIKKDHIFMAAFEKLHEGIAPGYISLNGVSLC